MHQRMILWNLPLDTVFNGELKSSRLVLNNLSGPLCKAVGLALTRMTMLGYGQFCGGPRMELWFTNELHFVLIRIAFGIVHGLAVPT